MAQWHFKTCIILQASKSQPEQTIVSTFIWIVSRTRHWSLKCLISFGMNVYCFLIDTIKVRFIFMAIYIVPWQFHREYVTLKSIQSEMQLIFHSQYLDDAICVSMKLQLMSKHLNTYAASLKMKTLYTEFHFKNWLFSSQYANLNLQIGLKRLVGILSTSTFHSIIPTATVAVN